MVYTPHTEVERQQMLEAIGVETMADLFADVPEAFRFPDLDLPAPLSEMEVLQQLQELSGRNLATQSTPSFLGHPQLPGRRCLPPLGAQRRRLRHQPR